MWFYISYNLAHHYFLCCPVVITITATNVQCFAYRKATHSCLKDQCYKTLEVRTLNIIPEALILEQYGMKEIFHRYFHIAVDSHQQNIRVKESYRHQWSTYAEESYNSNLTTTFSLGRGNSHLLTDP